MYISQLYKQSVSKQDEHEMYEQTVAVECYSRVIKALQYIFSDQPSTSRNRVPHKRFKTLWFIKETYPLAFIRPTIENIG